MSLGFELDYSFLSPRNGVSLLWFDPVAPARDDDLPVFHNAPAKDA